MKTNISARLMLTGRNRPGRSCALITVRSLLLYPGASGRQIDQALLVRSEKADGKSRRFFTSVYRRPAKSANVNPAIGGKMPVHPSCLHDQGLISENIDYV